MKLDHTPCRLWHYIYGNTALSRVKPKELTALICAGRMGKREIDMLIAVVETAKILNRITEKSHQHDGV